MTVTPTVRGFPDYMYPNGAAPASLFSATYAASAGVTIGPIDVSSWPVLQLTLDLTAVGGGSSHMVVRYNWDSAGSGGGTKPFKNARLTAGVQLYDSCPNYGSQLQIQLDPEPGAGTFNGTFELWGRGGHPGPMSGIGTLVDSGVQNVGAGATQIYVANFVTPGPALAFMQAGATGLVCIIDMLTFNAVWTPILMLDNRVGGLLQASASFDMPSSLLRMRVFNGTAGAIPYSVSLVPRGY